MYTSRGRRKTPRSSSALTAPSFVLVNRPVNRRGCLLGGVDETGPHRQKSLNPVDVISFDGSVEAVRTAHHVPRSQSRFGAGPALHRTGTPARVSLLGIQPPSPRTTEQSQVIAYSTTRKPLSFPVGSAVLLLAERLTPGGPKYRTSVYSSRTNLKMKVLDFVKSGGLPFTEDTTEPFSGISCTFFPGIKLSSGMGTE